MSCNESWCKHMQDAKFYVCSNGTKSCDYHELGHTDTSCVSCSKVICKACSLPCEACFNPTCKKCTTYEEVYEEDSTADDMPFDHERRCTKCINLHLAPVTSRSNVDWHKLLGVQPKKPDTILKT
jgi:hypothetical protein